MLDNNKYVGKFLSTAVMVVPTIEVLACDSHVSSSLSWVVHFKLFDFGMLSLAATEV